jgi:hypothetical protein
MPHKNQTPWSIYHGYAESLLFKIISCQIGSQLNLKCHLTCMSDLLQTWPTQHIPGQQQQSWIPSTMGTKYIQEGGLKREAPVGNPYVSNISPCQATDFQTQPSCHPVYMIGHLLCIFI